MFKIGELNRIYLGVQGENGARTIEIDVSEWLNTYPNGTVTIWSRRNGDNMNYTPTGIVFDSVHKVIKWTPTAVDTFYAGHGMCGVELNEGTVVKKSKDLDTFVTASAADIPTADGNQYDYNRSINKPQINGNTLVGDMDFRDLDLFDDENMTSREKAVSAGKAAEELAKKADKDGEEISSKIPKTDIVNNLTTTVEGKVLDARQGKALNDGKLDKADVIANFAQTDAGKALDATKGRELYLNKIDKPSGVGGGKFLQTDQDGNEFWGGSASPQEIAEDIDAWMTANVPSGTTIAIDRSLQASNAAAPADLVGDLKSAINAREKLYQIQPEITEGYFINNSGGIEANALYSYTAEFDTELYDQFEFIIESETATTKWLMLCFYNADTSAFINRVSLINSQNLKQAYYIWTNNTSGGRYKLRVTWMNTSTLTILKKENAAVVNKKVDDEIANLWEKTNKTFLENKEQSICNITVNDGFLRFRGNIGATVDLTDIVSSASYKYTIYNCNPYEVYTITGKGSNNYCLWAFLDSSDKILSISSRKCFEYEKRIVAPASTAKLIISWDGTSDFRLLSGNSGILVYPGTRTKEENTNNYYINTGTNVSAGSVIDFTPIYFNDYTYSVIACAGGDEFVISGTGGNGARLWAFVDFDDKLLSRSHINASEIEKVITAPKDACKLIVNSIIRDFRLYKKKTGYMGATENNLIVSSPTIFDLPKNIVSMPTVAYSHQVGQDPEVAVAKSTIYKNGDYFCITYGENLDGTSVDIPEVTESGVLAMKYKFFKLENGEETNVSYGTFAQKGDSYTDYEGNSAVFTGGCGLPSGIGNLQYFTSAYEADDEDPAYDYSGGLKGYGMTPCCCTVSVSSSGVTFGNIQELKLNVNGTVGKFDIHRIDPDYLQRWSYLTTGAPCYGNNYYRWFMIVSKGIAYLYSQDGITWIYDTTIELPFRGACECNSVMMGTNFYITVRSQRRNAYLSDMLYLIVVENSDHGIIKAIYRFPYHQSRCQLVASGGEVLLFYPGADKGIVDCLRILPYSNYTINTFWRWFRIYRDCTWYITCMQSNIDSATIDKMYLCGGNTSVGSAGGLTFLELDFDTSKPYSPLEIPACVD